MSPQPVIWVPFERLWFNSPHPEAIITREALDPLSRAILRDGFRRPLLAVRDGDRFRIRDGFHRWRVMVEYPEVQAMTGGLLPVVELAEDDPYGGSADELPTTTRGTGPRFASGPAQAAAGPA